MTCWLDHEDRVSWRPASEDSQRRTSPHLESIHRRHLHPRLLCEGSLGRLADGAGAVCNALPHLGSHIHWGLAHGVQQALQQRHLQKGRLFRCERANWCDAVQRKDAAHFSEPARVLAVRKAVQLCQTLHNLGANKQCTTSATH